MSPLPPLSSPLIFSHKIALPWYKRSIYALSRLKIHTYVVPLLGLLTPISGFFTYAVLSQQTPLIPTATLITTLLAINAILGILLALLMAVRWAGLLWARWQDEVGSRLHLSTVSLFNAIAAVPVVVVALFSVITFNMGVESWFSTRIRHVVDNSLIVAESYLGEHQQNMTADSFAMVNDLKRILENTPLLSLTPPQTRQFEQKLRMQIMLRDLRFATILTQEGRIIAFINFLNPEKPMIPETTVVFSEAQPMLPLVKTSEKGDLIYGLIPLPSPSTPPHNPLYLYTGRSIDWRAIDHMQRTQSALHSYDEMEGNRSRLKLSFALIYIVFALLIVMTALRLGFYYADRLVQPVRELLFAAVRVREGNLKARVPEIPAHRDIRLLLTAFNSMVSDMERQQMALRQTASVMHQNSQFIETILSAVTAGVLVCNRDFIIEKANARALFLLGQEGADWRGQWIETVLPDCYTRIQNQETDWTQSLEEPQGLKRDVHVRITYTSDPQDPERRIVITFDDVTDLLKTQRMAAWGEIARRIAHEIKNPLTPIQLSAERLQRKWGRTLTAQQGEVAFTRCTDMIIRQVENLRFMVDEFSSFSRMPAPVLQYRNVSDTLQQMIFLEQMRHSDSLEITFTPPSQPVFLWHDERLLGQALLNLLKNAAESIMEILKEDNGTFSGEKGLIQVFLEQTMDFVFIRIVDNGGGLPTGIEGHLTDPYVTTRDRGTGLGLAIVDKIIKDHEGTFEISNNWAVKGANVVLRFCQKGSKKETLVSD